MYQSGFGQKSINNEDNKEFAVYYRDRVFGHCGHWLNNLCMALVSDAGPNINRVSVREGNMDLKGGGERQPGTAKMIWNT